MHRAGRVRSCHSDYSDALRHNPTDGLAVAAYGNRGNAYRNQGEYDRAIADYDAALSLNPNDEVTAGLYFNRGNTNADQEQYDLAIADFDVAPGSESGPRRGILQEGRWLFPKRGLRPGGADYDAFLRFDAEDSTAYLSRGLAYFYKEEYVLAIDDFNVVLQLCPEFPFPYVMRGMAFDFNGQHDQAIADYESGS